MTFQRFLRTAGIIAVSLTALPGVALAAVLNGGAARVFANSSELAERVQYRRSQRLTPAQREAYARTWAARARVMEELDGTILLPGIMNDYRGRTIITGAPRSRTFTGPRLGVPGNGIGNRLTGGVPGVHRRR